MTAQQQLVSVDDISEDNAPLIYVSGGLKPFIDRVREEVSGEVPDLSTKKGRDRIASLAAKVSKSKVAVEKPGREYLKRLKEMPKVVEAELRGFVTDMDALRDEVRKPLTDWYLNFGGDFHTLKPFPMGIYPRESRLYWGGSFGGRSRDLWPWEDWLIRHSLSKRNLTPGEKPA